MPQQPTVNTENNFSNGYKTEYTALNFPENSAVSASNVIFNRIGNVTRRPGINYETNYHLNSITNAGVALSNYVWKNVGGDGQTVLWAQQVGGTIYFYSSTAATVASPLSNQQLVSTISLSSFVASGGTFDATQEAQYSDGNGILFIFHPSCDPIYCTYASGTITGNTILIQIRDFQGAVDPIDDNFRPPSLSAVHNYNLFNQGWSVPGWSATSTTTNNIPFAGGTFTWTIQTGLTISASQVISITGTTSGLTVTGAQGTVSSYNSGTGALVLVIPASTPLVYLGSCSNWSFKYAANTNINTFFTAASSTNPSNSDIWWEFKDSTGAFSPSTTLSHIGLDFAPAPKGHYVLSAFNQDRSAISSVSGISTISTTARPSTGCFYNQRVFYTGVKAAQQSTSSTFYYPWTESIYFTQIIQKSDQYGKCYQVNDPTSETLLDLLSTDGGTIFIQGAGNIFKLFPVENGILVFAANGIWFITGSRGIGFAADDYTITKISGVRSIASTSYVNVLGYPMFWNEDGIYAVIASSAGLRVEPLSLTTIQTFYDSIPYDSLRFVKGDYNPLTWEVRWIYRATQESGIGNRYQYDSVLLFNTITKGFSPWTIGTSGSSPYVNGIAYIQNPGGSTAQPASIKYCSSVLVTGSTYNFTFAGENDTTQYQDWFATGSGINFKSTFTTGYKLHGQGQRRFQTNYLVFYVNNYVNMSYYVQGVWDFAIDPNTGRVTNAEVVNVSKLPSKYSVVFNRMRINGRGLVYQFQVTSVDGKPFDIIGWSVDERNNPTI